ncbi:MAG: type II toxin-antitoxin system RelE/ParE family toxin [Verrucomicrobia bacterium]|nr:type II toxin-antitoxin system RelE/ParE family toxin [Verrucomicrobiota bacterium]
MKLIVKSPVWDDLREIGQRIATDNPGAAERFFAATRGAFDLLARHPGIGRLRSFSLAGVRSWAVPGFPNHLIFYLPTQVEVQILCGAAWRPRFAERLGGAA